MLRWDFCGGGGGAQQGVYLEQVTVQQQQQLWSLLCMTSKVPVIAAPISIWAKHLHSASPGQLCHRFIAYITWHWLLQAEKSSVHIHSRRILLFQTFRHIRRLDRAGQYVEFSCTSLGLHNACLQDMSRRLLEEQNAEYEASLAADREREARRQEGVRRAEEEARQKAAEEARQR